MLAAFRPRPQLVGLHRRYPRLQRLCIQTRSHNMPSVNDSDSRYLADKEAPLCGLSVTNAFNLLTSQEKLYAHWIGRASWAGARILQGQWTPYAADLYDLLIVIFSNGEKVPGLADLDALQAQSKLDNEEWEAIMQYTLQVHSFFSRGS